MLWARPSHMVSSRWRLMDSASLRRGSRSKSGSPGGIGRRFSGRFSLRAVSSSLPWSRTVMMCACTAREVRSRCTSGSAGFCPGCALLDALPVTAAWLLGTAFGGGDTVDSEQSEFAEQMLVVDAAECSVVDDPLRTGDVGGEAGEALDGGAGFAAGRSRSQGILETVGEGPERYERTRNACTRSSRSLPIGAGGARRARSMCGAVPVGLRLSGGHCAEGDQR